MFGSTLIGYNGQIQLLSNKSIVAQIVVWNTPIEPVDKQNLFIQEIQANWGLIYKIASVYTKRKEDREDLIQEIIYQLWKSYDSFQGQASRSTWMYRVAMNVSIHFFKYSKKQIAFSPIEAEILNLKADQQDKFDENWEVLQGYIQQLNLLERGLLMLYLEEKSYKEIASIMGLTESNVGTKLNRIKNKLKAQIKK